MSYFEDSSNEAAVAVHTPAGYGKRAQGAIIDLLLVLADRETDAGMVQHIDHLLRDRICIDRHRHATQRLYRREGPVKPRTVVTDDRHLVPGLQPDRPETERKSPDLGGEFRPVPAFPDAMVLVPHRGSRTEPFRVPQQILREGVQSSRPGLHR